MFDNIITCCGTFSNYNLTKDHHCFSHMLHIVKAEVKNQKTIFDF